VPAPIATPTLAWVRAGASLTPSPTMTTMLPLFCNSLICLYLSSGNTSAKTVSIPSCLAIGVAAVLVSPVSIATLTPSWWSSSTACFDSFLTLSLNPKIPITSFSVATKTGVLPSVANRSRIATALAVNRFFFFISRWLPTKYFLPLTVPSMPIPAQFLTLVASTKLIFLFLR